ncbi:hypothetical protein [Candidatus Vidania fulgoroideorum]
MIYLKTSKKLIENIKKGKIYLISNKKLKKKDLKLRYNYKVKVNSYISKKKNMKLFIISFL